MLQWNYLTEVWKGDILFNGCLFFWPNFEHYKYITKRGLFERAGMYLILSFYFVHILSFTAINDLFKYLRQNVEALEFTEVDVLNLAGKYGLG